MSYVLGPASRARLAQVHPDLVRTVERAIAITACDFTVLQGPRTLAEQARAVAAGTSRTMASRHLIQPDGFSHAVDLVPFIEGMPVWDWKGCYAIAAAMRLAASDHGTRLRWGGVWDRALNDINPATALGMEEARLAYASAFEAAHPGRHALADGPHFEIIE